MEAAKAQKDAEMRMMLDLDADNVLSFIDDLVRPNLLLRHVCL